MTRKKTVNVMKIGPTQVKCDDRNANINQIDTLLDKMDDKLEMAYVRSRKVT
jgi:hypothetical protein